MNYEKKYKEALDWMKGVYPTLEGAAKEDAEHYFPELKESEGERIRKEIINYFKCQSREEPSRKDTHNKWIAWLEKQGHTDGIIEKAKTEKQRVIITETDGNANIDWDTRSLEDARKLLECGLQYINTELEKQSKQNPVGWSEEDEVMKNHALQIINKHWNSLPDTDYDENEISESCYNWLKSLSPKKQWKPSEEQMEALLYETEAWDEHSANGMNLTSLYNDLKKL